VLLGQDDPTFFLSFTIFFTATNSRA